MKRSNKVNERSNKGAEFYRPPEFNEKRTIKSVDDNLSSLDFNERTHRDMGYSFPSDNSRREKQKNTNKIVAIATTGTVSVVTIVAVIVAAIVGISFVSFSPSVTGLTCVVDIPEGMEGDFVGVLYDVDGNEVVRTEVSGSGECKFPFDGLFPETQYYFSVFDAEGTQYLYESVNTTAGTQPLVLTTAEENYPFAVRISFYVYNPVSSSLTVTLIYDENSADMTTETFPLPDDGVVTARKEQASYVRVRIDGDDGIRYFDKTYALGYFDYEIAEETGVIGEDNVSFSVNILDNPSGFALSAVLVDENGNFVASAPLTDGQNEITFENLESGVYDAYIEDALGERYSIGNYYVGFVETQ